MQTFNKQVFNMTKLIPLLMILLVTACSSPNPQPPATKTKAPKKHKPAVARPVPSPWTIKSYPGGQGDQPARKYVSFETDGKFSNGTVSDGYANASVIVDKINAGILLRQSKKSNPAEKFTGPVKIRMKNSAGTELELTSSRGWNKSGGILIERNNNDYSQFRIFMLQSEGIIDVEITDNASSVYRFAIDATGFGDSFGQI
jgi:hypothetical protein